MWLSRTLLVEPLQRKLAQSWWDGFLIRWWGHSLSPEVAPQPDASDPPSHPQLCEVLKPRVASGPRGLNSKGWDFTSRRAPCCLCTCKFTPAVVVHLGATEGSSGVRAHSLTFIGGPSPGGFSGWDSGYALELQVPAGLTIPRACWAAAKSHGGCVARPSGLCCPAAAIVRATGKPGPLGVRPSCPRLCPPWRPSRRLAVNLPPPVERAGFLFSH